MIAQADIAHWQRRVPWPALEQVEQDLVLSRLIIEIVNHPLLGTELVFRGGTCHGNPMVGPVGITSGTPNPRQPRACRSERLLARTIALRTTMSTAALDAP